MRAYLRCSYGVGTLEFYLLLLEEVISEARSNLRLLYVGEQSEPGNVSLIHVEISHRRASFAPNYPQKYIYSDVYSAKLSFEDVFIRHFDYEPVL